MTFYKQLATAKRDDDDITAYEYVEKYESAKRYQIIISRNGIARIVIPTARTTWKRKFNELVNG